MKKKLFFILFSLGLLASSMPADAQIRLGLKGGVNMYSSRLYNLDDNLRTGRSTGFHVGPMMEVMLPLLGLGFDLSLLYNQKTMEDLSGGTARLNYLDVPLHLKWKFGLPFLKLFVATGPYASLHIGSKHGPDGVFNNLGKGNTTYGLDMGGGVELFDHLEIGLNYGLGLKDNSSFEGLKSGGKDRGWAISATYLF